MVISYLNPTYCAYGLFNSHLRTCASNLVAQIRQLAQHHDQGHYRLPRLPNRDRQCCVPAAIHRIGSLQSPFNPIYPPRQRVSANRRIHTAPHQHERQSQILARGALSIRH